MSRQRLFLIVLSVLTLGLMAAILTDGLPFLRGPAPDTAVWHWPYVLRPLARWWAVLLPALGLLVVVGWWLRQKQPRRMTTVLTLCLLIVAVVGVQWGIAYAHRGNGWAELVDRTLAVQTNGYFWTAVTLEDLPQTLYDYPTWMQTAESDHIRTHPPGLLLANWLVVRLLPPDSPLTTTLANQIRPLRCTDVWLYDQPTNVPAGLGVWAFLPLLAAATAVVPAYLLTRQSDKKSIVLAVAGVATMPALLIMSPLADQLYVPLTLWIIVCLNQGLQKNSLFYYFLAGLLLSIMSFMSLGNTMLGIVIAVYGGLMVWQRPLPDIVTPKWHHILIFGLGAVSCWLIYWLGWGVAPWEIAQAGLDEHYALVTSQRSYAQWFGYNLLDLLLFAGVPLLIGYGWFASRIVRRRRVETSLSALAFSVAVLLIVLLLSGSTRGEVGRIWLFMMPLFVVTGGYFLGGYLRSNWQVWWLIVLQVGLAISLGVSWQPVEAVIVTADQPLPSPPPTNLTPISAQFGDVIRLDGYALTPTNDSLQVTWQWMALETAQRPLTTFNHLLDSDGQLVAQQDGWAVDGQWPPSCWQSGDIIIDSYQINLPPDLPDGVYTLATGFYDARDGTRLTTDTGQDRIQIEINR